MAIPVVFLSSRRDSGDLAAVDAVVGVEGARRIACDPVAFLEFAPTMPDVEMAAQVLTNADLGALDASVFGRLRELQDLGPVEPLTGRRLAYLMLRTILYRVIPFEKSVRLAVTALTGAERLVLFGDPAAPAESAYPSEFQDLYPILETMAAHRGVPCERWGRPRSLDGLSAPPRSLAPLLVRLESTLMRVRARRVLAVELYDGVRSRLSEEMPGVAILPFAAPPPTAEDLETSRRLSEELGEALIPSLETEAAPELTSLYRHGIQGAITEELPRVIARGRAMSRVLRAFRPQVVVMMEDVSPSGRVLGSLARRAGAWTAVVQHGITGEEIGGTHVMPCVCHVHCAWGAYAAGWNYAHGAPPDSQLVVGDPMLDRIFASGWTPAPDVAPHEVVFASQHYLGLSALESEFQRMETLRALLPFEREGVVVAVKPHPGDSVPSLQRLVAGLGFTSVQWDTSLDRTLARPAVIVTKTSTVALEAILRSRPVVLAAFSGRGDRTGLSLHGAALLATTPSELTEAVRACLTLPEVRRRMAEGRQRLLPEYLDGMDGRATARLAQHLRSHLSSRSR